LSTIFEAFVENGASNALQNSSEFKFLFHITLKMLIQH